MWRRRAFEKAVMYVRRNRAKIGKISPSRVGVTSISFNKYPSRRIDPR